MRVPAYLMLAVFCSLLVAGCQSNSSSKVVYEGNPLPQVQAEADPEPVADTAFQRARLLADRLYEAAVAFDDNRLMSPPGYNAYEIYQEVLGFDPGNAVAIEGMENIVGRYIELADSALGLGQYDDAENYLMRAARLNPDRVELVPARARLAEARETTIQVFALDGAALNEQSLDIMTELAGIAEHIRAVEATFLINARTDAEGRWIYKIMREAVGGYRLRGNIDISGNPAIRVTLPKG